MRKIKDLGVNELHEVVERVKFLCSMGCSYGKIVDIIADEYQLRLSKATVLRWCKGTHDPFNRIKRIVTEPSPELSYVIGVYLGDGSIHRKSNGRYLVKLKVIDEEFAKAFAESLQRLGVRTTVGLESDSTRVDRFYVEGSNKTLFQLLSSSKETLFSLSERYPVQFLRGFFDSEGFPTVNAGKTFDVKVGVVNSDVQVLKFAKKLLKELGIRSRMVKLYSKGHEFTIRGEVYTSNVDMFVLWISRFGDVVSFYENVGFTATRKSEKLRRAIELKESYPPAEAIRRWLIEYEKRGRGYVKRANLFKPPINSQREGAAGGSWPSPGGVWYGKDTREKER
ncbi:LAGLIDADG family homing endonuclease [Thermococcus sp. JdF3]|uniref:LAGLIDADG family homing endonuclease n=1 Tax=Thermococcus sp. JdF3 TaxID=1638258 RepID=UPI00143C06EA|nr:LAGLIDADG family homing endonuclease [Thermococcus sp. JdF3]NJE01107.1 DNA endonuclease [Thermococcus sp. JdF3]